MTFKITLLFRVLLTSILFLILTTVLLPSNTVNAQSATASTDTSIRELIEAEKQAEQLIKEIDQSTSNGDPRTSSPLTTLVSVRKAMRAKDHSEAAKFLDMRYLPDELNEYSAEHLMQALAYVWGRQNVIDLSSISDSPAGNLNDGLPPYRDQIGSVAISTGEVPIYLQRVPDGNGGKIWKISNASVAEIPELWSELGYSPLAIFLKRSLPDVTFMGMDNWQLGATIFIVLLSWPLAMLASFLLMRIALIIPNRFPLGIKRFFRVSMRFFLFVLIVRVLTAKLGLSLTARIFLDSSGVDYIAYTVLAMGILSLLRDYQIRKMQYAGNTHYVALLKPFTTITKIIMIGIIRLFWAKTAGYDMSTILAGLGVGSLAVALAAQKTLENVIGAITLYVARPVSAGDFCRFGKATGTVEEIGLRSTLIRTLDRTMMVIPNSVFSSLEIENYSARDRIRYFRMFKLQLANAEQMRFMLAQLRQVFYSHPQLLQETVSIRFVDIVDTAAILRLDAGVSTTDYQAFLAVAEDLNLRVMDVVHDAGAIFSGPGQSVQLREIPLASAEQLANVQNTLQQLREQERLPFPNYSEAEIASFKDSLQWPPTGASGT